MSYNGAGCSSHSTPDVNEDQGPLQKIYILIGK